jgi:hypothetical protein
MSQSQDPLAVLEPFGCGWQLHRISATTALCDIQFRASREMSETEIVALQDLLRTRHAYRCRIGKDRWHFGRTALEAAQEAANSQTKKGKKST